MSANPDRTSIITTIAIAIGVLVLRTNPVDEHWGPANLQRTPKAVFREMLAKLDDCAGIIMYKQPSMMSIDILTFNHEPGFLISNEYSEPLGTMKFDGYHPPLRAIDGHPWWTNVDFYFERRAPIDKLDPDDIKVAKGKRDVMGHRQAPGGDDMLVLEEGTHAWTVTVGTMGDAKAIAWHARSVHYPPVPSIDGTERQDQQSRMYFYATSKTSADAAAKLLKEMIKLSRPASGKCTQTNANGLRAE